MRLHHSTTDLDLGTMVDAEDCYKHLVLAAVGWILWKELHVEI